ncbi:hydroxyquinol 1,2-dioxygenase [Humitalea rosea]|uniref:Hydroxyquinol 1,2-dioxygenase n=1 Tax=Humitalea rosea TaxID=990373 RepID=A0A2W7HZ75_9PROT|nr:dioxygenase [Humitalea rosea]PZW39348.1 hydroxyquinol 1,2-dioxygenase [Humitalea rosea]
MQDLDSAGITEAVLAQMADTPDARLREIADAAVRHLHDFAREVNLKPDEWLAGIAFMTAVGQACTPYRQEFILLSDVLGLSRLVNVMHDVTGREAAGTETSLLGPFFREQAPKIALGDSIAKIGQGEEIMIFGQVTDAAGKGVPGAQVDVWQTDAEGAYDLQAHDPTVMDMRGQFRCDAEGRFRFRTVRPLGYMIPMDGPVGDLINRQHRHGYRPAHIHFLISAPEYRELVTALYFADDEHVDSDTVFGVSRSLVISPAVGVEGAPDPAVPSIRYDFCLSRETEEGGGRVGSDPSKLMPASG